MKKKWMLLIVILIAVAVVLTIVFINLFRPKNTQELALCVNNVTQSGYLSEDNQQKRKVDEYLNSLLKISNFEGKEDVRNYANAYSAFVVAGEFFNKQIVFTQYTNQYKANLRNIKKDFENAQANLYSLNSYILENEDKIGNSAQWLAASWSACKADMENCIQNSTKAFEALTVVYENSVPSKYMNNDLTSIVFKQFNVLIDQVVERQVGAGAALQTFVGKYFSATGQEMILNFQYNLSLQEKVEDIKTNWENSASFNNFLVGNL